MEALIEIDHDTPVAEGGRTEIENLNRVCHHHHDLKHADDLRIAGEGTSKQLVAAMRAPPGRLPVALRARARTCSTSRVLSE